ncbi:HSPB1-associated protein 1-like [Ictidomys tridecemlineatus]|nr:HSPB1-associated protein 1-like [Ictidomys tridecemlineatus]
MAAGSEVSSHFTLEATASGNQGQRVKPFTPEKAKEIIMSLQQPAIFCNMVFDWPARHWTAKHLSEVLHGKQIRFRMGMKNTDTGKPGNHHSDNASSVALVHPQHWFPYL